MARPLNDYVVVEDLDRIGPMALAVDLRTPRPETIEVKVPTSDVLIVGAGDERFAIAPLPAKQLIRWPGIGDRSLFDLNVRRALGRNRVQISWMEPSIALRTTRTSSPTTTD